MPLPDRADIFVTTRWTAVVTAGRADTARAQTALAELCQTYWYPLYAYVRRRGHGAEDAEDLTQGFFERLLRLESVKAVARENGKFRAFLLASMNHYLADEWDKATAQKRSIQRTISLDAERAENRYQCEPVEHLTPQRLYERQWAMTLLETVVQRLCAEYASSGRGDLFMALRFTITSGENAQPYAVLAGELAMSEEAVRVAVHRLRKRYRQLLREEISQTVTGESGDSCVTEELEYLRNILSS